MGSVSASITIATFIATALPPLVAYTRRLSLIDGRRTRRRAGPDAVLLAYGLARRAARAANAAPAMAPRFAAGCVSSQVERLLDSDSPPKSPRALS